MKSKKLFTSKDSVVDLIDFDYNVLTVLSRFSLPLGFGNMSIGELCNESGINVDAFLLIINYLITGNLDVSSMTDISPVDITDFLHNSHDYYLSYKLPHIRTNLVNAMDESHNDINPIIIRFFDDYVGLVKHHFNYEETVVFPYVKALYHGEPTDYSIDVFKRSHDDEVAEKLAELKNIILRYYTTSVPYKMYDVLVDIYNCEEDLDSHAHIENNILIPIISGMEKRRAD